MTVLERVNATVKHVINVVQGVGKVVHGLWECKLVGATVGINVDRL